MVELSMKTGKDVSRLLEMAPDAVPLPVTTMKIIKLMATILRAWMKSPGFWRPIRR